MVSSACWLCLLLAFVVLPKATPWIIDKGEAPTAWTNVGNGLYQNYKTLDDTVLVVLILRGFNTYSTTTGVCLVEKEPLDGEQNDARRFIMLMEFEFDQENEPVTQFSKLRIKTANIISLVNPNGSVFQEDWSNHVAQSWTNVSTGLQTQWNRNQANQAKIMRLLNPKTVTVIGFKLIGENEACALLVVAGEVDSKSLFKANIPVTKLALITFKFEQEIAPVQNFKNITLQGGQLEPFTISI